MEIIDSAHHADNQRRFTAIEAKLEENTKVQQMLVDSTKDLLEMWGDAGVFFKWMRRLGALLVWIGKISAAIAALWGISHYWGPK
jgi:hypothetical protein